MQFKCLLVILILGTATVCAQNTEAIPTDSFPKTQTLFSNLKPKLRTIGLYIAPEVQYLGAAGSFAPAGGGSAMLIFNERFSIGLAQYQTRSFSPSLSNNTGLNMNYGYGGLAMGFSVKPHKLFHLNFPILVGAGMARLDSNTNFWARDRHHYDFDWSGDNRSGHDAFFVAQVGANLEVNVAKLMKVYIGGSYRLASGSNLTYPIANGGTATLSNSQLSGLSAQAGIKLGLFDISTQRKKRERKGLFERRNRQDG
jgi:hypothetical protein